MDRGGFSGHVKLIDGRMWPRLGGSKEVEVERFNPHASREHRAFQAWLILMRHATERRTVTYKMLSIEMYGRPAQGTLGQILGCIAFFCRENELPALNCIVVRQGGGIPGHAIPESGDEMRERVYEFPWYDLYPPTPTALADAFERAKEE